jgi:hypothetical protein
MPTCVIDCPYDLSIVIANVNFNGNWQCLIMNGSFGKEGANKMRIMKAFCLA